MDLNALVKERKTINKLQKLEMGAVKQEDTFDYADETQLELMMIAASDYYHGRQ